MLRGLPASGKSTYAEELVNKGWIRANKDDIRATQFPFYDFKDETKVVEEEDFIIENALKQGKNVVVDDTNFVPRHRLRLESIAHEHGAKFEILFIDTPLEVCIKRNRKRAKNVPLPAILGMHDKYIEPLRSKKIEQNPDLPEAIIVDIDGTLASIDPRNSRDPYDHSKADKDLLNDAVQSVVNMAYGHGYKVIILTGRSGEHHKLSQDWLDEKGVNYDFFYGRAEGDGRPDYEIKEELFDEHIKDKYFVKYILDDRPSVTRMWRYKGLEVLQVGNPYYEF